MKKHNFLIAMVLIAFAFVLFSCDGEMSQTFYKVSLDFNNGDEVLETDVPSGLDFTIPKIVPVKENYEFDHWLCNGEKYKPGDKITISSNLTVTAVWKEKSKLNEDAVLVTFVFNGKTIKEQTVEKGKTVGAPTTGYTVPEGYELDGWYINDTKFDFSQNVNESVILTAKLNQTKYKVVFNLDGKTVKEVFIDKDKAVSEPTDIETKEGCNLDGWYIGSAMEKFNFSTVISSDIVLNAKSVLKKITVIFNPDNGTAISAKMIDWGTAVNEPDIPSAKSETLKFDGWYTDDETKFDFTKSIKEDVVLKAHWITKGKVSVIIKYENGLEENRTEYTEGVKYNLPEAPVYEGHTFLGWIIDNATTTTSAGTEIILDESKVITAKWEINKVKVTFNTGEGTAIPDKTINWGETLSDDFTTTREGYDFEGWKVGTESFELSTQIKEDTELTADWKIKTFTVSFLEGTTELENKSVNWNTTVSAIETPTKAGYTFSKWLKDGVEYSFDTPVTENITLTSSWTVNTYEIVFDTGVEATIKSQTVEYGKKVVEPATDSLTKAGHYFDGWLNGTEKYDFDSTVEGPLTLKANWGKNKYTVEFFLYSYPYMTYLQDAKVFYGDTVSSPYTPKRDGYTFNKWLKDGVEYDFDTPVTGDLTLTADWTLNKVKVTFMNGDKVFETKEVYYGTTVAEPDTQPASSVASKKFGFWANADTEAYSFNSSVCSDITLNAVFIDIDEHYVIFDCNGYSSNKVATYKDETVITLPSENTEWLKRDGYKLSKWKDSVGNEYDGGASYIVTDSITFTAVWVPLVEVNFIFNNGEESQTVLVAVGDTVPKPTDPVRENSTFEGWYYNSYYGNKKFDFTKAVTTETNYIWLEAKYSPETYTVTFDPNYDGGEKVSQKVLWGQTIVVQPDPKKDGYTFAGWFEDENAEFKLNTKIKKDYTLTAHWVKGETTVEGKCVVTYDFNDPSLSNETLTVEKGTRIYVGRGINTEYKHPEGKTLARWKDADGNSFGDGYGMEVTINEDCTYTAVWEDMIVTVYFCSGYTTLETQQVKWGDIIEGPKLTKTGYNLEWKLTLYGTEKYDLSNGIKPEKNWMNLFVMWTPISYTVTVNANRGKDESTTQTADYGSVLNLATPEYEGYRFLGWYDGEEEFDIQTKKITKSMTLTAKWEKASTFNVIFCYLDGTEPVTKTVAAGNTVTFLNEKSIDGLVFQGWYKGNSTFEPFIFTGKTFDFSQKITSDIYLYAKYNLSNEKLIGTWNSSLLKMEFLKETDNNIINLEDKFLNNGTMDDTGSWNYSEDSGNFNATFTGKFATFLTGEMGMYQAQNLGEIGENLIAVNLDRTSYTYKSERAPSATNVIGKWTREDNGQWIKNIEFSETKATSSSTLYSDKDKRIPVSTTSLVTDYEFINTTTPTGVSFVKDVLSENTYTMSGYEDAVTTFNTSLTYAVNVDTFYLVGFMGNTTTCFTRGN